MKQQKTKIIFQKAVFYFDVFTVVFLPAAKNSKYIFDVTLWHKEKNLIHTVGTKEAATKETAKNLIDYFETLKANEFLHG